MPAFSLLIFLNLAKSVWLNEPFGWDTEMMLALHDLATWGYIIPAMWWGHWRWQCCGLGLCGGLIGYWRGGGQGGLFCKKGRGERGGKTRSGAEWRSRENAVQLTHVGSVADT